MKYSLLFTLVVGALLVSACSKQPCSGKGMSVDTRPLTPVWSANLAIPEGGVMCYSQILEGDDTTRQVEFLGLNPQKTADLWEKTMTAGGWLMVPTLDNERGYELVASKEGFSVSVFVSKAEKGKGWSTVKLQSVTP